MAKQLIYAPLDLTTVQLRWLGYLYIFLLIFEGALRKWILPEFSDLLILIRDPVVLVAYAITLTRKQFPFNKYVNIGLVMMTVSIYIALFFTHENLIVAAFGFRANFLHIPFAFIIGQVFYQSDVIRIGRFWLWGSIVMTALIVWQFYSPQTAWVNRAPGGLEGGGFAGAVGRFRPPGTFTFIVGVVWFYAFAAAFLISGVTQHKRYSKFLLGAAAFALIMAIPVSISRSLMLAAALTLLTGMLTSTFQTGALLRYFRIALISCIGIFIASQFPVFDESKDAFLARWEQSTSKQYGGVSGSIVGRVVLDFTGPFFWNAEIPFFGYGIGAGTQFGVQLLYRDKGFDLGEGEWYRLIAESGLLLGTLYIAWRFWITVNLGRFTIIAFRKGNGMGLILFSATGYNLLIGQWGQTTIGGFTIVGIGLTIASMRSRKTITASDDADDDTSTVGTSTAKSFSPNANQPKK